MDASAWVRCDAETSPQRGLYYHPSRHSAGQPIVAGWAYQWIAQLSFARDSWTAPLSVCRLDPHANPHVIAGQQIIAACRRLDPDGPLPIFVCDAGYDPLQVAQTVEETRARLAGAVAGWPLLLRRPDTGGAARDGPPPAAWP